MLNLLNTAASRALDQGTIRKGLLSEVDLMRNAGRQVAVEAGKLLQGDRSRPILIVCGGGHNGGDGVATGGFLQRWGYPVKVVLVGRIDDMDEVVSASYREAGIEVQEEASPDDIERDDYPLVIDALLGIGVNSPLREPVASWVRFINGQDRPVMSVDIPTGLNADTGRVWNEAVKADVTVTMGHSKLGLTVKSGPDLSGRVVVADIGFIDGFFDEEEFKHYQFVWEDFASLFKLPERQTFKYRQGKTLIIAGSRGMTGAAVMASRATILSGTGLTVTACPASIQHLYATPMPEVITLPLEDYDQGFFLPEHGPLIRESLGSCSAVVLGPGLSRSPRTMQFVKDIFEYLDVPTLLDADGLSPFNGNAGALAASSAPMVLTPHAQEFAQLFDHDLAEVMHDPVGALLEVRAYFSHTVVLKGAPTMSLLSTGEIVVNSSGNPGMATAGSGDVLSGIIGTFLSQGYSTDEAAIMGVWIHGRAGDLARDRYGAPGMTSLQILEQLPLALAEFEQPA